MINKDNILTDGYSGRFGNLIFRRWGKKTVISMVPDYRNRKWSKAQKENRKRFSDAMAYSRKALVDPEMRRYYRKRAKGMQTVWNVAVADYMKKPEIREVDLSSYRGKKGDTIQVNAQDNYRVAAVIVTILNAQGLETESGLAVEMLSQGCWIYKVMAPVPGWEKGRIVVRVTDSPGNTVKSVQSVRDASPPG
jgi:hypothetical protein